jgi:hypothetical protein
MMETPDHEEWARCPECEEVKPERDMRICSICGKSACGDCMCICNCGCDAPVHLDCSVVWEKNNNGREFRWTRICLMDHARKLEDDAHESIIIAARARELAK